MQNSDRKTLYQNLTKRRRVFLVLFPIQVSCIVLLLGLTIWLGVTKSDIVWLVICGVLAVLALGWLLVSWQKCRQEEYALCKQKYSYLWRESFDVGEPFETIDEETGTRFTITNEGIKIVYPLSKDYVQVFDELAENEDFLPWTRTRLALATWKLYGAGLALAVIDVGTAELDEDGEASYEEPFIIPFSELLVKAVKTFGLEDKAGAHWWYLFYDPEHALKQICKRGYIRVARDKNTGTRMPVED